MNERNNHEYETPKAGRRKAIRSPETEAYLKEVVAQTLDRRAARLMEELYGKYGDAFGNFLALDGMNTSVDEMENDFRSVYIGTFANRAQLIQRELEAQNWTYDLQQFAAQEGIPAGFLMWDDEAIWGFLDAMYDIWETHEAIHVYEKWKAPHPVDEETPEGPH